MPTPVFHMDFLETALAIIIITDLCLLGLGRQIRRIRFLALQGLLMGLLPIIAFPGNKINLHTTAITLVFVTVKGVLLPYFLYRTHKNLPHQRPATPYLDSTASILICILVFILSIWLNSRLGVSANPMFNAVFPAAFTTIIAGLLLIVTRKKALTQVFGYLTMENGIYLLGIPIMQTEAIWIELSILLDILVGIFVMGIAIHRIHQEFSTTNVDQFSSLRD